MIDKKHYMGRENPKPYLWGRYRDKNSRLWVSGFSQYVGKYSPVVEVALTPDVDMAHKVNSRAQKEIRRRFRILQETFSPMEFEYVVENPLGGSLHTIRLRRNGTNG